jgi:hypothetical protein
MHCELAIPGLFRVRNAPRLPALELLLARARRASAEARPAEDWMRRSFGMGEAALPAGALTVLARGGTPGADTWMRADPVHLRVMHDRLVVVPAEAFELSHDEANALCDGLNAHFAGMEFSPFEPRRWCARLSVSVAVGAAPALESAGREAPAPGPAAELLNEMQMALHAHPVNAAREARGEPPVNSLWLWGAGRTAQARCPWQSVAAGDPALAGAARLAGARARALPRSAAEWLEQLPGDARHLAFLDALRAPLALAPESAPAVLEALERDWFAPLLGALRAGRIGMATLHVPDGAQALSCEVIRGDLRRFWRRPRPLARYA